MSTRTASLRSAPGAAVIARLRSDSGQDGRVRTPSSGRDLADVAAEAVNVAGGGRALLLQIAHPAVGRGVVEHSDFATRVMDRLHATMTYVYASVYAAPEELATIRRAVNRAHVPVHADAGATGPAYNAFDPELQLWVAATLYDTMIVMYERTFGALSDDDADRIYQEFAVVGTGLQLPRSLWPADRREFAVYWNASLARLRSTSETRRVAEQLLRPRGVPWWVRVLMPQARIVTIGLLPARVRTDFGFAWTARQQGRFERRMRWTARVYPRLPAALRHRPKELYLQRLRRMTADEAAGRGAGSV